MIQYYCAFELDFSVYLHVILTIYILLFYLRAFHIHSFRAYRAAGAVCGRLSYKDKIVNDGTESKKVIVECHMSALIIMCAETIYVSINYHICRCQHLLF